MNLNLLCQRDQAMMRALKVDELKHVLCHTSKGVLTLNIRKGESERDYHFVLDAVPLTKEANKEMFEKFSPILDRLI